MSCDTDRRRFAPPPPSTPPQAERTAGKAALAQRLISGLAGEFSRWTESIQQMATTEGALVGDVLLSSSFVTYAGTFNAELRAEVVNERWLPDLLARQIPATPGVTPLDMLSDESLKVGSVGRVHAAAALLCLLQCS